MLTKQNDTECKEELIAPAQRGPENRYFLGILVSSDLTWSSNVDLRTSKALRAVYRIKRNVSKNLTLQANLNAYTGYVVPILVCSYRVSHLTNVCLRKVEKIQRLATKWFFGANVDYKTRLMKCGLLPLLIKVH